MNRISAKEPASLHRRSPRISDSSRMNGVSSHDQVGIGIMVRPFESLNAEKKVSNRPRERSRCPPFLRGFRGVRTRSRTEPLTPSFPGDRMDTAMHTIFKDFTFAAAHAIRGHTRGCQNLH